MVSPLRDPTQPYGCAVFSSRHSAYVSLAELTGLITTLQVVVWEDGMGMWMGREGAVGTYSRQMVREGKSLQLDNQV